MNVAEILPVAIGAVGVMMFIWGYSMDAGTMRMYRKPLKQRGIRESKVVQFIVKRTIPDKDSKQYIKIKNLMDNALIGGGVERLYENKSLTLIFGLLIVIMVGTTNTVMRFNLRLNDYSYNSMDIVDDYGYIAYEDTLELERDILYSVWDRHGLEIVFMDRDEGIESVIKVINDEYEIGEAEAIIAASRTITKIEDLREIITPNGDTFTNLLIAVVVLFMLPNGLLRVLAKAREKQIEEEISILERLFMVLGSVPDITVENMLPILISNSKIFRDTLEEFYSNYLKNRRDAYDKLIDETRVDGIERLMLTIRRAETTDRSKAIEDLRKFREARKDYKKSTMDSIVENKETLCLVLYFPALIFMLKVLLDPWLKVIMSLMGGGGMFG